MQAIADAAGVAVQTVYYLFGTKAALLSAVEAHVVLGDRPARSWREAQWADELAEISDPHALIARFVPADPRIKSRISTFAIAVGPALARDPDSRTQRQTDRDESFRFLVDRLAAVKALRPGLTAGRAFDIVSVLNSLHNYVELTSNLTVHSRPSAAISPDRDSCIDVRHGTVAVFSELPWSIVRIPLAAPGSLLCVVYCPSSWLPCWRPPDAPVPCWRRRDTFRAHR
jgi:AcrR family transcriptional regulator